MDLQVLAVVLVPDAVALGFGVPLEHGVAAGKVQVDVVAAVGDELPVPEVEAGRLVHVVGDPAVAFVEGDVAGPVAGVPPVRGVHLDVEVVVSASLDVVFCRRVGRVGHIACGHVVMLLTRGLLRPLDRRGCQRHQAQQPRDRSEEVDTHDDGVCEAVLTEVVMYFQLPLKEEMQHTTLPRSFPE
jgi:hypothetical protein